MSDFLIYAARLQDAGVKQLLVTLDVASDQTRIMHVNVSLEASESGQYPTRTFELDGTDRLLLSLKDELAFNPDNQVTQARLAEMIRSYPVLKDDLVLWYADWMSYLKSKEEPDPSEDDAFAGDDSDLTESSKRLRWVMMGMDLARKQAFTHADPQDKETLL